VNFFHVVNHAEEIPLAIDLGSASQSETIQAQRTADIGKDGFHRTHPHTIDKSPCSRVYFMFHFFSKSILTFFRPAEKIGNLPYFGAFRMTKAL
jgi:hypothetical protein